MSGWGLPVERRALLAGTVRGVAGLLLTGLAAPVSAQPPVVGAGARRRALEFLDAMLDAHPGGGALRLPQSYADQSGLHTTGFTYDAALAVLAYLTDERAENTERARLIGEASIYVQQHDPQYTDGRLRQAYHTGPYTRDGVEQPHGLVLPDGTANIGGAFGFTGSGTGENAWAGLALCELHRRTGDDRFLGGALRVGGWIVAMCWSSGPLGGFAMGVDRAGTRLSTVSTANNATLVALFARLAALTGDRTWLTHRDTAARLVTRMWNPVAQAFVAGVTDDGAVDDGAIRTESQTQAWLALRDPDHAGCLDTVRRRLTVTDTTDAPNSAVPSGQRFTGVTVSTASMAVDPAVPIEPGLPRPDPRAVWLEGTAQYALALYHSASGSLAGATQLRVLTTAQARLGISQTAGDQPLPDGSGVVAATSPLHVGYVDSGYYPYAHVAATAWFLLAATATNPLR